jgi:hypothetical protein
MTPCQQRCWDNTDTIAITDTDTVTYTGADTNNL